MGAWKELIYYCAKSYRMGLFEDGPHRYTREAVNTSVERMFAHLKAVAFALSSRRMPSIERAINWRSIMAYAVMYTLLLRTGNVRYSYFLADIFTRLNEAERAIVRALY